jgi:predicted DsbA family dithiol-disulfide isomerase
MKSVLIHHFSDVLCIWAYVAQARVDELCEVHGEEVQLDYHYVDVFGDVPGRITERWREKGGLAAYSEHVVGVASKFEHIELSEEVWSKVAPNSSTSCHQFLHALGLACGPKAMAETAWALRLAFFAHARDVSLRKTQFEIAEERCLHIGDIENELDSGAAMARVSRDLRKAREQNITVSPTLVFNEGRQMLKGNVGYRAIEANISELLSEPRPGHSWC